jgi:hypothetical protein
MKSEISEIDKALVTVAAASEPCFSCNDLKLLRFGSDLNSSHIVAARSNIPPAKEKVLSAQIT